MRKPGTWEFKMHQLQNWCNSVKMATKGIIKMKPTACAIQKKPFIYLENWKFTPYHSLDILGHAKEVFPPSSGFLGVPFPKTKN